jgi:hypothetical protein
LKVLGIAPASALIVVAALALLEFPRPALASGFDQRHLARLVFPENGATMGQGISLSNGQASNDTCVEGGTQATMNPGANAPQVVTLSLRNNTDASTYLKSSDVSASAQATFIGGGVDVKVTYITSHQFSRTMKTLSVRETVESRLFLVPTVVDSAHDPDSNAPTGIRLKNKYATMAADPKQLAAFRKACGDGFITSYIRGAELLATLSVFDSDDVSSQQLKSSLGVSYFGASGTASLDQILKAESSNHRFALDILQVGGAGDLTPIDEPSLINAVGALKNTALQAPNISEVIVRDYATLPNGAAQLSVPEKPSPLDQIMSMYWRVDATMSQVRATQDAFRNPRAAPIQYYSFNESAPGLDALFDALKVARDKLHDDATTCAKHNQCHKPSVGAPAFYAMAVQLPLPSPGSLTGERALQDTLGNGIDNFRFRFDVRKAQLIANVYNIHDPTCYKEDRYLTQKLVAEHFGPDDIRAIYTTTLNYINTVAPAALRDDAVDYYVRQPAQKNCNDIYGDPDCEMDLAKIVATAQNVKLSPGKLHLYLFQPGPGGSSVPYDPNQDDNNKLQLDRYGCPGGFALTPIFGWYLD